MYRIYTQTDGAAPELVTTLDDRDLAIEYVADHVDENHIDLPEDLDDGSIIIIGNMATDTIMWAEDWR